MRDMQIMKMNELRPQFKLGTPHICKVGEFHPGLKVKEGVPTLNSSNYSSFRNMLNLRRWPRLLAVEAHEVVLAKETDSRNWHMPKWPPHVLAGS